MKNFEVKDGSFSYTGLSMWFWMLQSPKDRKKNFFSSRSAPANKEYYKKICNSWSGYENYWNE